MVVHKTEAGIGAGKFALKDFGAAALARHADKMLGGGDEIESRGRHLAGGHAFQVVKKAGARRLPAEADFVDLIGLDFAEVEAGADGVAREAASCLTRLRRSSATAKSSSPSRTRHAEESCVR